MLRRRTLLFLALLVGTALRVYPMHRPYVGPDLQDAYPRNAIVAVVQRTWTPFWLGHGPAFFARQLAKFDAVPIPLPPGVVYDPIDADYIPLRGWEVLSRPGPNLTIWEIPPAG